MDPVSRAAALDELAGSLRERMLARAGDAARLGDADPQAGIRELVEREVALLDPADREELVARVAERSFGLGRWSRCATRACRTESIARDSRSG